MMLKIALEKRFGHPAIKKAVQCPLAALLATKALLEAIQHNPQENSD
jgi:hypothetical protein